MISVLTLPRNGVSRTKRNRFEPIDVSPLASFRREPILFRPVVSPWTLNRPGKQWKSTIMDRRFGGGSHGRSFPLMRPRSRYVASWNDRIAWNSSLSRNGVKKGNDVSLSFSLSRERHTGAEESGLSPGFGSIDFFLQFGWTSKNYVTLEFPIQRRSMLLFFLFLFCCERFPTVTSKCFTKLLCVYVCVCAHW